MLCSWLYRQHALARLYVAVFALSELINMRVGNDTCHLMYVFAIVKSVLL